MKKVIQATVVLLGSIYFCGLNAFAANTNCIKEEHFPLIQYGDLAQKIKTKSVLVIDVNSKESYDKNHITGAIHYGSHKADFDKLLPEDKNAMIVAYCGGPQCSAWKEAAERACDKGYTNIHHYKEGIKGWVKLAHMAP